MGSSQQSKGALPETLTDLSKHIWQHLKIPRRLQSISGTPNESQRYEILKKHTKHLRKAKKLDADVDLHEMAALTENFTVEELEDLVRAAESWAFYRLQENTYLSKICSDIEKKLLVYRSDFIGALIYDTASYNAKEA